MRNPKKIKTFFDSWQPHAAVVSEMDEECGIKKNVRCALSDFELEGRKG